MRAVFIIVSLVVWLFVGADLMGLKGIGRLCDEASVTREGHGLESRGCTLEGNF